MTDSLVDAAGIIMQEVAEDVRLTDARADEVECGITIKSTENSLSESGIKVQDVVGDVQMTNTRGNEAERDL